MQKTDLALKEAIEAAIDASVDLIMENDDDMAASVILSTLSARGYKIVKDDDA